MITQRRVFQAKVGASDAVVAKIKEFEATMHQHGFPAGRIFTDLHSGRTDRVAWEIDIESLAEFEKVTARISQDADVIKVYQNWYEGLKPLITGANVSMWTRIDS
jgi:hypothetical protein